jgi:hypothetical protein
MSIVFFETDVILRLSTQVLYTVFKHFKFQSSFAILGWALNKPDLLGFAEHRFFYFTACIVAVLDIQRFIDEY